jgi:hypothetical protein
VNFIRYADDFVITPPEQRLQSLFVSQATIERAAEGQPALAWPPVQSGKTTGLLNMYNEDLAKFNRDGSTGQTYVSHLPGHSELYMIMPFKDLPQQ